MIPTVFMAVVRGWSDLGIEFREVLMFLITMGLLCLMILMLQSSHVQSVVNSKSRCYRERQISKKGGTYFVEAKNENMEPMYKIGYDFNTKTRTVSCTCTPGTTVNQFKDIKVYDLKTKTINRVSQNCNCKNSITAVIPEYSGYPDLVRFMNSNENDTSFFKLGQSS